MPITRIVVLLFFLLVLILGMASQVGYLKVLNIKLFGRKKEAIAGIESRDLQTRARFERRSLVEKSRPLLLQGLIYAFVGILAMVVLFILATRVGVIYSAVGFVVTLLAIIFLQARSNTKYLINLVETTRCPQCGKFPMNYLGCSADKRRLLICTQCRTEWDLGPAAL